MARTKRSVKDDGRQQHFHFHFAPQEVDETNLEDGDQETLSEFERRLRLTLREVLDGVAKRHPDPLDRYEIAARMSRLLGREITKSHIDGWIALSAIQRRIHADALRALCQVIEDWRPMHYYAESCGFKLLDPDMAQCAEFGALMLSKKGIDTNIREFLGRVDEKALLQSLMQRAVKGGEA